MKLDWVAILKIMGQALAAGAAAYGSTGEWSAAIAAALGIGLGLIQKKTVPTK